MTNRRCTLSKITLFVSQPGPIFYLVRPRVSNKDLNNFRFSKSKTNIKSKIQTQNTKMLRSTDNLPQHLNKYYQYQRVFLLTPGQKLLHCETKCRIEPLHCETKKQTATTTSLRDIQYNFNHQHKIIYLEQ